MSDSKKIPSSLAERCFEQVNRIPKGRVTTYKLLAEAVACKSYQAIGQILTRNPHLIATPCHRVIKTNGEVGGYAQGCTQKIELLVSEGIEILDGKVQNLEQVIFSFD